jgi:hypothetical protein
MPERSPTETLSAAGYVYFHATGDLVAGDFYCSECGYGVSVARELPRCPMCSGTTWERRETTPILRRLQ